MKDLSYVHELFDIYSSCLDTRPEHREYRPDVFVDPTHDDAAKWLAATPEERDSMRPHFESRLAAVRKEHAREFVSASERRLSKRTRDAARMRAWREANPEIAYAKVQEWRRSNPDKARSWYREWRAAMKLDEERYQKHRQSERERLAKRYAAKRASLFEAEPDRLARIKAEQVARGKALVSPSRHKYASDAERKEAKRRSARERARARRASMSTEALDALRAKEREAKRKART